MQKIFRNAKKVNGIFTYVRNILFTKKSSAYYSVKCLNPTLVELSFGAESKSLTKVKQVNQVLQLPATAIPGPVKGKGKLVTM